MVFAVLLVSASHYANSTCKSKGETDSLSGKPVEKKFVEKKKSDHSYWGDVMNAIIQVESGGNSKAVNGKYVGAMQIAPIVVKDCNSILLKRNIDKRYKLSDRYSVSKSKEMFLLIQSQYNPSKNIEKGIRIWNGGCNYRVSSTNGYLRKVLKTLKNV